MNKIDLTDMKIKWKRKNQILFSRESACLQDLLADIKKQSHQTLVLWALKFVEEIVITLENKYPDDNRPRVAIEKTRQWARGDIKMPEAKKAILAVHAMAKDITDVSDQALCHAVGQGCGTVHVETHAIGLVVYELTAIVRRYGLDDCEQMLIKRINEYQTYLLECAKKTHQYQWAKFISDDPHANKEYLLGLKKG